MHNKVRVSVTGPFCILMAMMLLTVPLGWILAVVLAAAVHELSHCLAIRLCGGDVQTFYLGRRGAVLTVSGMTWERELFSALAGPIGGLLLLLFARWIPRTALCAAFHSAYNLLPIYPLDGGRALRCLLTGIWPRQADNVCRWVAILLLGALCLLSVYVLFRGLGWVPVVAAAALVLRSKKYLAKHP